MARGDYPRPGPAGTGGGQRRRPGPAWRPRQPTAIEEQAGLLAEQIELLALVRDTGVTSAQLRAILQPDPAARQAVADLIQHTTQADSHDRGHSGN